MTQPPTMISDSALGVENRTSIAMATPPSSQIPRSISPQPSLESQLKEPFQPTTWQGLTSIVHKPQCWQVTTLMPLKTTKILLRFHHPMTMAGKSRRSLPRDLDLTRLSLPKGWVYKAEEVCIGVKTEVVDPSKYLMLDAPLTRCKHKQLEEEDAPHTNPYR
jgi:hypothetical protein